jgi:predicted nucleic acid-binding protein
VTVYVESNFILEAAALQEEHQACMDLLRMSEQVEIRLVIPAFALAEPFQTVHRRHAERLALQRGLNREISLLSRSVRYVDRLRQAAGVASILDESRHEEQERLDDVLLRTTAVAEVIPLDAEVLRRARELRAEHDLRHADAVILASVYVHLASDPAAPSIFLQRDRKDFLSPDITARLASYGCSLLGSFAAGIGRLRVSRGT